MFQDAKSLPLSTGTADDMNTREATALVLMMVGFLALIWIAALTCALPEIWQLLELAAGMLLVTIVCIYSITTLGLRRFPAKAKRPLLFAYCSCICWFVMGLILYGNGGIVYTSGTALWLWILGFMTALAGPYVLDAFRKD
ncbi:hypothetical protein AC579_986 [Pseudocercospora musae]|uniref:Uncharacterized protein n=1 Tax=Pseudocercospora musae TaxID=113226 RepID=A0A139I1C8_9PEZI|nr:hypothetical protein AC579_986 [Pseudocercospora musae]